jgi:hypothetical protein
MAKTAQAARMNFLVFIWLSLGLILERALAHPDKGKPVRASQVPGGDAKADIVL